MNYSQHTIYYSQLPSAEFEYDPIYGDICVVDNEEFTTAFDIYVSEFEKTRAAIKIQWWWRMKFKF